MYEKLVALDIHGRESQIVRNFANKPEAELVGRELTSDVVLKTNEAKGKWELPSDNPLINETRLNYHRVAYNLLSMALMRTQKDERFFSGFLFKDTEDHRTWENIVDASVQLKFLPDLAKAMKMTWYEDSIRRKIKNERKDDEDKGNVRYMETLQTTTERLVYIQLYILISMKTLLIYFLKIYAVKTYDDMPEQEINSDTLFSSDEEQELMEVDQISENPCMKPFRNVIERLHTLTTKKILDRNEIPTEMPLWMKELHKTFTSPATSLHVRLFFAKAIILNAIPFEPYAQYWMRPLMQLVLDGNQYGHPMNYMVHSMAVIIEVWGQKVKMKKDNYNDRYLLYQYVDYLMGNVFYENIQVVKTNIQIIKDVFQNWGENIVVPTNTIYKELATERPKNGDAIGLQLAGIVLAHDMDPFYEGPEVNLDGLKEETFYKTISKSLMNPQRNIVQTQMVKVLYLVSQLYGDPRITALQIIAGGSEGIPDLFKSIQSKKLLKTLTRGDDKSQLCLIQILDKIANTLTLSQIDLTHLFFKFIQSVNNTVQKEKDKILGDKLKVLLLQGLVDSSDYIRNSVMAHIKTSYNLGDDIYERLNIVLGNLYLPEVEDKYLLYSTEIILDTTKHGDDYDVAIFKNPLPNAKFDKDYQRIDTSWQLRNPMSPLFVATQEPVWFTQDLDGGVRATQTTFQFSLTQQAAATEPGTLYVDLSQQATDDYRRRVGRRRVPPKEATQYDKATERIVNTTADSEAMHYSFVHDRRRKQARRTELLQKQARDKRVTMTRQYRFGELPDVQIRHSELVLPLQVLGRSDNDISRVLHALLSVSISHQAEIYRTKDGYMENIAKITHSNLEKSTEYYPPAIGSFLRICYEMPFAELSSSVIKMASQRSYNENIAIALLERHFLTYVQGDAEHPAKRSRTTKTAKLGRDKKQWIDLAQLYKSIDQPEIFQNLYQSHVASVEGSKVAIDYEIQGRYAEAVNYFVKAHDDHKEDVDPEEVELWMQEMLRCYEQLTEWQDMGAFVNGKFDGKFDTIWDDPEKDEYVKYFMRSYTKMRQGVVEDDGEFTPWTDDYPNPVLKFIASANEVPDRMKYLLHHVACDISLNSIWTNDYDRARFYTRQSYDSLLSVWTSLHPLAVNKRMAQLATLERTVELEDFLDVVSDLQRNAADIDKVTKYIRGLLQKYPDTRLDAMDVWDDIIDSRNLYLDELEGMQRTFKDRIPNQDIINDCKKQILKAMISAAKEQHNVNVLRSRFKRLDSLGIGKEEKVVMILKNRLLMAPMTNGKKEELSLISKMIGSIVKNEAAMKRGSFKHEFLLAAADAFELARRNVQEHPELSFTTLTASGALTTLHLQCIWKLAQYCDNALTVNEENQPSVKVSVIFYSRTVIDSYFKAMELGKTEAIERFPRLLELIERYPANGPEFKMKAESFGPVWMYIRWIPQMVAILDNPIGEYVFPAVYQIAKIYPNALYYAFRISNEHFSSIWDTLNNQTRDRILKIDEAVKSPIMERFIVELTRLTNPEHILGSFVEFIEDLGSLTKDFAVLHHSFLQELFGVNGSKISKINEITFRKLRNYSGVITEKLKKEGHKKPVDQLISYSPFLSEFQGIELDEELEVPGQYTGMRRPHPEDHARIVNFDQRLLVMSSIRKPKRLRIHGSDERDYYFLVKGGEDLRLDQRIQQLFGTMNDILFNDPYCVRHNVNIRTYKVVPMSTNVGVIEWISDTAPLGVCIKSVEENVCAQAVNTYGRFFHQFVTDKDKRGFCTAYIKAPRDRVVQNFQASGSFFRADILRDYFLRLAASPEAFLYLRDDFAHSLAAVSISGYVLGIGDRHLENFLVDTNSGKLVAIDFGHAFGSATEILQIPELMPFRLTRQLTSVFEPIGISGMLEIPMTHILQAFHDNKSVLLNTMDVFIKEPLLDWRKSAIRETKLRNPYSNSKGTGDTSSSAFDQKIAWFPQQKLETARNKLSLENPGYTMSQSVLRNINVEPYRIAMGKVARGDSQFNIRARIGEKCASVQEQVRCLIDLATDPHILGHTWAGWSPTM
ncbi:hypothetical protein BDA99DRAFT_438677 [Phascolomyces articulosus]|uniref:DNA-dependent protein kinase catalytic subunit n=1 Tax=Phascolomyces articulosus TaxID=60185 RepID=A0AAD5JZJ0_9FUNG|nr:hypothetical protein BDA99DRAFT_438677 [Phascolomyces articulosus]